MDIDWKAPFQLAWDLGLFLIGSILVVFIVGVCLILLYGIIKSFFAAFAKARNGVKTPSLNKAKDSKPQTAPLKSVE